MHSSRMRTAHSLTVSHRILCMPPTTMHAPCNHTHPQQPCMPPTTTHTPQQPCMPPWQQYTPPSNHAHPLGNHTCPPQTMHTPLPTMQPPLWTEFLRHASETSMHSSRMHTICSLTISCHIPCTYAPLQPRIPPTTTQPPNHACPLLLCMPPTTMHAPLQPYMPPATMHAPQQPHMPPSNHTCPPQQPCTPPLWTEFLTHASENITLPQLCCGR